MPDLKFSNSVFFLIFIFGFFLLEAQISDTLYHTLPKNLKPANRHKITLSEKRGMVRYAHEYAWTSDKLIAGELDRMAAELEKEALNTNDKSIKIYNYATLEDYYQYFKGNEQGSWVPYCDSVIKYAAGDTVFRKKEAYAYLAIGIYRVQQSKHEEASEFFNKALHLFTQLKDTIGISSVHAFFYPLYSSMHLFKMAINEQNLMLRYMTIQEKKNGQITYFTEENYQDKTLIYLSWYEITRDPALMDSANFYINRTPLTGKNADRWKSFHYFLEGYRCFLIKDYGRALSNIDSSLAKEEYYSEIKPSKLIYKGLSLLKLGRREEAKALLLDPSIIASDHNLEFTIYEALYMDALARKEYPEALNYLEIADKYKDSAAFITQRGKVFEVMQKYSVIEKEIEIKNLELTNIKERERQNMIILVFIIVGISLIVIIISLYNLGRERKMKTMQTEALLDKEKRNMEDILRLQEREIQRERKKAVFNLRKKISRDMHDELTSALAGLKYYVNDLRLKESEGDKKKLLQNIEQEVESVYAQARSYMHNLNAGIQEVVGNLNPFLQHISRDLSRNKDLVIKLKYDKVEVESRLSTTQQNQLTLMLKEAMSNILKHSGANKIEIAISFGENICHFSISDNGRGFGKAILEKGLGMESMELRIKRIKGQTSMHSSSSGTHIKGSFPLS
jgi:signal transduction histidine kinase